MKKLWYYKKRNALAAITIVLMLGFLSILTMTSVFTYNIWRWENLNTSIIKDTHNNASTGLALMQYIYLIRNRDTATGSWSAYDNYENTDIGMKTTVSIGSLDTLDNCNTVELPSAYNDLPIKRITASNQLRNFYNTKTCCTPGVFNSGTDNELLIEELINSYSKEDCKNLDWPNLKHSKEPLITSKITQ